MKFEWWAADDNRMMRDLSEIRPADQKRIAFLVRGILALALALGAPSARAQTIPERDFQSEIIPPGENQEALTLESLEQLALERNPTLVQAGAQVRISRGKALQAGLLPNPSVGYVADQIGAEGTAGEFHGMFVEQQIITGGKLELSRAKYIQEARQAELQVLAQRFRVLFGVRAAYYEALVWQRRLVLQQQFVQNSENVTKTLAELVNVGQANQTDMLQAKVQLQRAKANFSRTESRARGAWEKVAAVAGMPELEPAPLEDLLDHPLNRIDRDTALTNLLMCSPELRVAQAEVARDQISVRRERAEPIPNVNVRAEAGYNFEAEDTVAGLEVGLRLPLFDKNQGTIMQAQAELVRARAEVARVELKLRERFAGSFAEYEAAMILAESYRAEILPQARESYDLYLESFQARRAAWPQVLDAQREYFEMYEEFLDNVLGARLAETRINSFFLDDGLDQPPVPTPEGHRDSTARPR